MCFDFVIADDVIFPCDVIVEFLVCVRLSFLFVCLFDVRMRLSPTDWWQGFVPFPIFTV